MNGPGKLLPPEAVSHHLTSERANSRVPRDQAPLERTESELPVGSVSLPHAGMFAPLGANTSTEKVKLRPSPGCNAPTPTTWRPTSSPLSFLIEIVTEYSH